MSFSFNFNIDGDSGDCVSDASKLIKDQDEASDEIISCEAAEILVDWSKLRSAQPVTERIRIDNDLSIEVVSSDQVEKSLVNETGADTDRDTGTDTDRLVKAVQANSDLLPRVYEGGLKIWECSIDLVQYLSSLQIAFRGTRVLELGCGAGLPGLYAYHQGAHVTFQDYNSEVLSLVTAANVLLNEDSESGSLTGDGAPTRCTLIAGDWKKVQEMLTEQNQQFDYIFTSETIYSPESYSKLHDVMATLLKPGGTIYLAAKTYYFGVGGGTRDFEAVLDKQAVFDHIVCKEITEGVQREIMKLTLKTS